MELGIYEQAWQFVWSVLLGILSGICYDTLWGVRHTIPFLTWIMDLIMGIFFLIGNWLLFLYVGDGSYRIFFLPTTALGFFLWKKTMSKYFRVGIRLFWRIVFLPFEVFLGILKKFIEKIKKFLKNLFSKREKSSKIKRQNSINGGKRRCVD